VRERFTASRGNLQGLARILVSRLFAMSRVELTCRCLATAVLSLYRDRSYSTNSISVNCYRSMRSTPVA